MFKDSAPRRPLSPLFGNTPNRPKKAEQAPVIAERTESGVFEKKQKNAEPQTLEEARESLKEIQEVMGETYRNIKMLENEIENPSEESPLAEARAKEEAAAGTVEKLATEISELNRKLEHPAPEGATPEEKLDSLATDPGRLMEITKLARNYDEAVDVARLSQKPIIREAKKLREQITQLQETYGLYEKEAGRRAEKIQAFANPDKRAA